VLIVPHDGRRQTLANVVTGQQARVAREFREYPHFEVVSDAVESEGDVVIVDLDGNAERALDLVENICANHPSVTVMVYSSRNDADLLLRCMRAGARELLTEPVLGSTMAEALVRASARVLEVRRQKKALGKALVFTGAKGGSGVTTIASNFAVALAKETGSKVALLDGDLQLGDAALSLGMTPQYSIADALQNEHRIDSDFLSTLLAKHSSGLEVLAAPDTYRPGGFSESGTAKVLRILQNDFAYVVVDAGCSPALNAELFALAETIYLVTQVNVPALRNSHRLISYFSGLPVTSKVEVVLNRFDSRLRDIDEAGIAKALTQPARWRVPNDEAAVRRAQNTAVALATEDSAVSRVLQEMARVACGKTPGPNKKKKFSLFG
jgi:pilus assembly protein CpaE